MEKRVFLAIFLSFIVLVVYQTQFAPAPPPAVTPTPAVATPAPNAASNPGSKDPGLQAPGAVGGVPSGALGLQTQGQSAAGAAGLQTPPVSTAKPIVTDTAARDIVVETEAVTAIFTSQGGVLKSYRLRHYRDAKGTPLELIPTDLPEGSVVRPFTISTDDAKESATLATALYRPNVDRLSLGSESGTLTFEYGDDSGLTARKSFYFQPNGRPYLLNVEASVDVSGKPRPVTIKFGPGLGLGYSADGQRFTAPRVFQSINGSVQWLAATDIETQPRYEGAIRFSGVDDQYFLAVALPGTDTARVEFAPVTVPIPADPTGAKRTFIAFSLLPNPGAASSQSVKTAFFIGPKKFDELRSADAELTRAIDFGMFRLLVVPLLQALNWVHGYLANWGWSIVVLTILINILIFPLRHRSMVSMKKMQAIQPQVKAIQERYAKFKVTDPERQKMNTEMLALYKQKGVHPASGCLPMLLTMPILLAFYSLLSNAIELRGAPFIGWIHDLASKDPTYVWPILMGGTMFWQQRMMPSTADPMQQKIFLFMPVIFTVMFLSVPSGLVVYWLVSNLLTIAQQYLTNRILSNGGKIGAPRAAVANRKG